MHSLAQLLHQVYDVEGLIRWGGYFVLLAVIFAETGLLLGFFLPGDSLLVTAGLLAAGGLLNVWLMAVMLTVSAIAGQSLGYFVGQAAGARLFTREDSLLFKRSHLLRAHEFYERHGGKTVVIARFMPIFRTFVPVVAGAARMDFRLYTIYNVVGGTLWIWGMLFTGYSLGRYIPGIGKHIDVVILVVIALSLMPGAIAWLRQRRTPAPRTPTEV
jgi:membrane-associated protein